MPRKKVFKDIRDLPDDKKELVYARIDRLHQNGTPVLVKEHRSGFPAITIQVEAADAHINIITDCLSAEQHNKNKVG